MVRLADEVFMFSEKMLNHWLAALKLRLSQVVLHCSQTLQQLWSWRYHHWEGSLHTTMAWWTFSCVSSSEIIWRRGMIRKGAWLWGWRRNVWYNKRTGWEGGLGESLKGNSSLFYLFFDIYTFFGYAKHLFLNNFMMLNFLSDNFIPSKTGHLYY